MGSATLLARGTPAPPVKQQGDAPRWRWIVLIVLVGVFGSVAGLAAPMQYAFPVLSVFIGGALLWRRRWYTYLTFALGLWVLAPAVRRIADWQSTYHDISPILAAAPLVSLLCLPWALATSRRTYRDTRAAMIVALVVFAYGFAVGLLRNGIVPAAADVLNFVGPFALGLFVLMVPNNDIRLRQTVQRFALWGVLILGVYGLVQFLVAPAWDTQWLIDAEIATSGRPYPYEIRVFSTLNSAGPFAQVIGVLLLLLVGQRKNALTWTAGTVGVLALGLSLVRSAWLGVLLGVLMLLIHRRLHVGRLVAAGTIGATLLVLLASPVLEAVSTRVSDTAAAGTSDTSLVVRLAFQAAVVPQTLADVAGDGMGATGSATKLRTEELADPRFRNFDSGLFENLTVFGSVPGAALLGVVVVATVAGYRRARGRSPFYEACVAALATLVFQLLFGNPLQEASGAFAWTLLGLLGRPSGSAGVSRGGAVQHRGPGSHPTISISGEEAASRGSP